MTTYKLAAFLALSSAPNAFAFTPSPRLQKRQAALQSFASKKDEENPMIADDGLLRNVAGGAAAFITGMGIMAQVAFADPTAIAPIDEGMMSVAV